MYPEEFRRSILAVSGARERNIAFEPTRMTALLSRWEVRRRLLPLWIRKTIRI